MEKRCCVYKRACATAYDKFCCNTLYGENYATHNMKHIFTETQKELSISYKWKVGNKWNHISCIAEKNPEHIVEGSAEEFITEHYWGYTFINKESTGVYEVAHPRWRINHVKSHDIVCSTKELYGGAFVETLNQQPKSVLLAEGSPVQVMKGSKIFNQQ